MKVYYEDLPVTQANTPEFDYCRKLIKDGVDPNTRLEFWRKDRPYPKLLE